MNTHTDGRRAFLALLAAAGAGAMGPAQASSEARTIPPFAGGDPPVDPTKDRETAVLAGGCFWGVQAVYQHVKGVVGAVSGYAGGEGRTAVYGLVGRGDTGHAEAVQVVFNPREIGYARLLQIHFSVAHDPTQLNRQGPDRGTQYRSAIFPADERQARLAAAYIDQLNKAHAFRSAIVTTVEPGKPFFPAEGYHQDFLALHPTNPYIVVNDLPKIEQLKGLFPDAYRADPVLVSMARKAG